MSQPPGFGPTPGAASYGQPHQGQPHHGQLNQGQPPYGQPAYPPAAQVPPGPAPVPPALPVEERSYVDFLRTPRFAAWRPIVALLMMGAIFVVASIIQAVPMFVDLATGRLTMEDLQAERIPMSPMLLATTALGLALLIPGALLTQKACFGQAARWLHSVEGRFRWGWALRCLAVILPLWAVWLVVPLLFTEAPRGEVKHLVWYVVITLLLIPFQAAGEEYMFRGLILRSIASWIPNDKIGLAVGGVISSVLFMFVHGAGDPWLNVYYFGLGMLFCLLTWRTGGLEAASVLHAVNNVLAFLVAAAMGQMDQSFDRGKGVGDPTILISLLVGLVILALLEVWHRRGRWLRRSAPGRELIAAHPTMR